MVLPRPKRQRDRRDLRLRARRWTTSPTASCPSTRSARGSSSCTRRSTPLPARTRCRRARRRARPATRFPPRRCTTLVDGGLQDTEQDALRGLRRAARLLPPRRGRGRRRVRRGLRLRRRERAETLGVALQLINIIRDVREDWELGRVYLPQDELAAYGVSEDDIAAGRAGPEWRALMAFQASRARAYLDEGLALLDSLDWRSAACVCDLRRALPGDARPDRGARVRRLRRLRSALAADEAAHRGSGAAAMRAAVVGGGLAGLSAALELVDAGHEVTLYEARPTLGGAVQTLPAARATRSRRPTTASTSRSAASRSTCASSSGSARRGSVRRSPLELPVIDERGRAAAITPSPLALLRYRHVSLASGCGFCSALARWGEARAARPSPTRCGRAASRSGRSTASGTSSSGRP